MCAANPSVLLDLDGTLVDSQPGILSSCSNALRALGHDPGPSLDLSGLIGPPIEDVMRSLLRPYGDDRVTEAVAAYRADYGLNGLLRSTLYAGVPQALADLRRSGAQLYLATSKRRTFAVRILEHTKIAAFFDGVYGSEDGGALDHKPELIAHIVERHALAPDLCVMVGDRRYDITGAHANKIRAIGVLWGYGSRDELKLAGADCLVADPADLLEAVFKLVEASSEGGPGC
jgi:phosphoglycolate phosphatase